MDPLKIELQISRILNPFITKKGIGTQNREVLKNVN